MRLPGIAAKYNIDDPEFFRDDEVPSHYLGPMDQLCPHCGARFWNAERTSAGKYTSCCGEGKVRLPKINPPPYYIQQLLLGATPQAKTFLQKPIAFNTAVSFASISMNQKQFPTTHGVPALRISGSVYHNIGAIHSDTDTQAKFMQCFFYDGDTHPNHSFKFTNKDLEIHSSIMDNIRQHNPFLQSVKQALAENSSVPLFRLIISDKPPPEAATRTYNRPTVTEISAIIAGDGYSSDAPCQRNVIIQNRGGSVTRIASTHSSYDPLAYVITHMHGDKGWTYDIPKFKQNEAGIWILDTKKYVSACDYYSYRMHTCKRPARTK